MKTAYVLAALILLAGFAHAQTPAQAQSLAAIDARLAVISNIVARINAQIKIHQDVIHVKQGSPEPMKRDKYDTAFDVRFMNHIRARQIESAMKTPEWRQIEKLAKARQVYMPEEQRLKVARAQIIAAIRSQKINAAPSVPRDSKSVDKQR